MRSSRAPSGRTPSLVDPAAVFREALRNQVLREAPTINADEFFAWAAKVPEPKGPLDFERFPFQRDVYKAIGDSSIREVVIQKGVQVGASAMMARLALYGAYVGLTSLYLFPAKAQLRDFYDARFKPLLDLLQRTGGDLRTVQNKGLFAFGEGLVNLRGSQARRDVLGVDADVVIFDEYDDLHTPNISEAERRISGSQIAAIRRLGVPSHPESGIAKLYADSDRRQWLVACEHCSAPQPIDFFENVDWQEDSDGTILNSRVVCASCRRDLNVRRGEWVPERPGRSARPGFHIHRLLVPGVDLRPIIEASKRREPLLQESFWRNDLGRPYVRDGAGLSRADIAAAQALAADVFGEAYLMPRGYVGENIVTAGVDVASRRVSNIRISEHLPDGRKRALHIGTMKSLRELEEFMDRFKVNLACVDHQPEMALAEDLATRFDGRILLVRTSRNQINTISYALPEYRVTVQGGWAFDRTVELIRAGMNLLPADVPAEYINQMVRPYRTETKDDYGAVKLSWKEPGDTDYFHAEVFDFVASHVMRFFVEVASQQDDEDEILDVAALADEWRAFNAARDYIAANGFENFLSPYDILHRFP